jgi:hypothetical protein
MARLSNDITCATEPGDNMAKLLVTLNESLETSGFLTTSKKTFEPETLTPTRAKAYYSKIDPAKLSLYLVAKNPEDENDGIGFEFPLSSAAKGAKFDISPKADFSGLDVRVDGTLAVTLRPGVKEYLKPTWKLRVQGVAYLGGSYRGFLSYLKGQDESNEASWMEVKSYQVK